MNGDRATQNGPHCPPRQFTVSRDDKPNLRFLQQFESLHNDGSFRASIVLFEKSDIIYRVQLDRGIDLSGPIDLASLDGSTAIELPVAQIFPDFDPDKHTRAPHPLPDNLFRKLPYMVHYKLVEDDAGKDCTEGTLMKREAEVLEILGKHPHENIVRYHGCMVRDGVIVGLCLDKLDETLGDRRNRLGREFNIEHCVEGIRRGVEHMHSLGLCHNDISVNNVMYRNDDGPFIIDFDSCRYEGEKLGLKTGTQGYYDLDQKIASKRCDWEALDYLEKRLRNWGQRRV